eukprot:11186154-Lingulodinium_polyedra.AAC.1
MLSPIFDPPQERAQNFQREQLAAAWQAPPDFARQPLPQSTSGLSAVVSEIIGTATASSSSASVPRREQP